jgi:hypothetical protein
MLTQSRTNSFGFNRQDYLNKKLKDKNALKEGIIVNNFIKGSSFETTVTIPEKITEIPDLEKKNKKQGGALSFLTPISIASLGVSASLLGLSVIIKKTSGLYETNKLLTGVSRYIAMNDDNVLALYYACRDRSKKSIMAASVIMIATAFSFVSKNVVDGYKDIWFKKKEADFQKNLQDRLIDVETRSFAGKHQIIKNMILETKNKLDNINKDLRFKGNNTNTEKKTLAEKSPFYEQNWFYAASLAATLGVSFLLCKSAYKNICQIDKDSKILSDQALKKLKELPPLKLIQKLKDNPQIGVDQIIEIFKSSDSKLKEHLNKAVTSADEATRLKLGNLINEGKKEDLLNVIENLFNKSQHNVESQPLKQLTTSDLVAGMTEVIKEKQNILIKDNNIFAEAPVSYYGYANKAYFSSVVSECTSFLYAMLLSPSKATRDLFLSVSSFSGLSYLGTKMVEAVKDFQVKKQNTDTEYELHDRLVQTELKNFKSKKESIINSMVEEYQNYKKINPTAIEKLQQMYNNILEEIQNGAPYFYS